MKFEQFILFAATLPASLAAAVSRATKPPYFILTGDSTVAINNGWGDGFLSFLKGTASGINRAKSGATTKSFRNGGRWNSTISDVTGNKDNYRPIVTIQFGHNDQKATSGVTVAEYRQNLIDFVNEVNAAGGTAILITSLTRRNFKNGKVNENLSVQRGITIAAAKEVGAKWLDLNLASINYVNAIGNKNATYYDKASGDKTHLNDAGEKVFGRMVADLLLDKRSDLDDYFNSNKALSEKIRAGEFATGNE